MPCLSLCTKVHNVWVKSTDFKMLCSDLFPDDIVNTRNVEFTERAVNDLDTTQEVEIGHYQDAAPVSSSIVNPSTFQDPHKTFNMETYDLNGALCREYPVLDFTWQTSAGMQFLYGDLDFPSVLFNQTFIKQKINDFRLFRAGIRISVRVTASKFLYGKLLLVYIPLAHADSYLVNGKYDLKLLTGYPHLLISATASEAATLDVPFISPNRALDLRSFQNEEMGKFQIYVLNPLLDIQGTANVAQVFVTAQFLDAELMLPHHNFVAQSRREGYKKTINHSVSSVHEIADTTSGDVATKQFKPYTNLFENVIEPAATAAFMLGLSKPSSTAAQTFITNDPFHNFPHGKGLDNAVKLSMDPECGITTLPNVGGIDVDEMNLQYVIGTPMLRDIISVTPTSNVPIFDPSQSTFPRDYVEFISNMFYITSGSYKVKVYVTSSLMHAVRGVIYLSDDSDGDWQNCYHKVVDIQGDTEIDFVVPYTDRRLGQTNPGVKPFLVYWKTLNWSQADPAVSSPIFFNVYVAGASDFQFGGMKEVGFEVQSNPRADFSKDFAQFAPDITGYTHDKMIYGERYTSVREMAHRYSAYFEINTTTNLPAWSTDNYGYGYGAVIGIEMLGLIYRFWRGSIRMRFINYGGNINGTDAIIMFDPDGGPMPFIGTSLAMPIKPDIEVEVPYYAPRMWNGTKNLTNQSSILKVTPSPAKWMFKAAGDDFSFHFISPFPYGRFIPLFDDTAGAIGLSRFFNAT